MKNVFGCLIVALLVLVVPEKSFSDQFSLQVRKLHVKFVSDTQLRVKGELRCIGVKKVKEYFGRDYSVDVNVDFPHGKDGFTLLPDFFHGLGVESEFRNITTFHRYRGNRYRKGQKKAKFYNSAFILRPEVFDKHLVADKDNKKWFAFDKTLTFKYLKANDNLQYRVVFRWKIDFRSKMEIEPDADRFNHGYVWVVYGPFRWGDSPVCKETLKAAINNPASFTKKGIVIEKPENKKGDQKLLVKINGDKPDDEKEENKKPKLIRPKKVPTHLEAIDASLLLKKKLAALPGIEGSGVGLPPKLALVRISYAKDMKPEDLTQLVTSVSLETAYAASWIETMKIVTSGDQGSSTVTITWNSVEQYTTEKLTLQEFYQTWKIEGKKLVAPKKK